MKTLRPYQDAALKSLWAHIHNKPREHPLIVAPVAAGKSLMIAEFIKQVHEQFPRTRIIMLTHVKELLEQNAAELSEQYPDCDYNFYCAGLGQKRLHNDVTFASVQSICKKAHELNRAPAIIIIDECHLISHKDGTRYRQFINDCIALNPNCRVIGFTGTPFRSDTGRLDEGENKLFDTVAYEISMGYMIEQGYWAKPVCPAIAFKMDTKGVKVRGGDYAAGELQRAINTTEINDNCVRELLKIGASRRKWLVFTAGVQHCEDVCIELHNAGISVAHITGKTPPQERIDNIERFRRGEIQCLVNVAVLTTGFNVPDIDLLCFMRPTRSPVLYIQTVGRGVRPVYADGYDLTTQQGRLDAIANSIKPDCMIVDFGGVVDELGAIDTVSIRKKYTGEKPEADEVGEAVMKICPSCGTECAGAQRYCYSCSYCFIELSDTASSKAVVSMDEPAEWFHVMHMHQAVHTKKIDGSRSMKVSYATMADNIQEWVCFEHHKYEVGNKKRFAWNKAVKWHKDRIDNAPPPTTIEDAVNTVYPQPSKILVKKNGKYWNILDYEFGEQTEGELIDEDDYFEIPF